MVQSSVFISYSRKDEKEKEELLNHLAVIPDIYVWSDDQIGAGVNWEQEIEDRIAQAKVAILLVTANFLRSDFIRRKEVPRLLERQQKEGLTIIPIIARHCAWQSVPWLTQLNIRPRNASPIWHQQGIYVDEDLAIIANEVASIVMGHGPKAITPPSEVYHTIARMEVDLTRLIRHIAPQVSDIRSRALLYAWRNFSRNQVVEINLDAVVPCPNGPCPNCNLACLETLEDGGNYCPDCGYSFSVKIIPNPNPNRITIATWGDEGRNNFRGLDRRTRRSLIDKIVKLEDPQTEDEYESTNDEIKNLPSDLRNTFDWLLGKVYAAKIHKGEDSSRYKAWFSAFKRMEFDKLDYPKMWDET